MPSAEFQLGMLVDSSKRICKALERIADVMERDEIVEESDGETGILKMSRI